MAKLFLTGDRSFSPIYPGLVVIEMFKASLRGDEVMTGDNPGVEALVREIAEQVGLGLTVVPSTTCDDGRVDWDTRHKSLADDVAVRVFHVEPMSSSIVKSALRTLSDERVEIVTPVELLG